ncbi:MULTISPECIES: hypothetical protein [Kordiimonas]|uniref:Uncharacterized protein n=2 Tax=Kordiimonas lacus TaxID=637679 RepID=A0A1G6UN22_9PROT|nr:MULTISPECIES: hypothetical protein [Kordiimonas]SDD42752.1 hypothetical protein SAMN04488071_0643 [Kordiimonas lacus]
MPTVNLELQMKFLTELNEALTDALDRYADEGADKLAELNYMKQEVARARLVIAERMDHDDDDKKSDRRSRRVAAGFQEAAFS